MSNILKVTATTTIEVSSDILNKEAGALVKDAIQQLVPIVIDKLKDDKPTSK